MSDYRKPLPAEEEECEIVYDNDDWLYPASLFENEELDTRHFDECLDLSTEEELRCRQEKNS